MAENPDRPRRPGGPPKGKRPGSARPAKGTPAASGRPGRNAGRDGKPGDTGRGRDSKSRDAGRGRDGKPQVWTRDGKPARGDRSAKEREMREDRDPFGLKSVRGRHNDPIIPDEVQAKQLDRAARAQLKTLSKENAEEVARHLVMAARLIDENPALAHQHALSAARRAGRIAVVRETLAITAYSTGDFALALRELRTYRRISGLNDQLPMMVDSERGLGRPNRALELGRSVPRSSLPDEVQAELAIAMSGARLDLGDTEAALVELQIPQLDPDTAYSYSPALFDAYAAVLEDLGRTQEAAEWLERSDRAMAALAGRGADEAETVEIFEEDLDESPTPPPAEAAAAEEPDAEDGVGGATTGGAEPGTVDRGE